MVMDAERKQKRRTAKLLVTEVFMVVVAIALVIVLTFVAMGYQIKLDGTFEQSGLLEIGSQPTGATVEIDGEEIFSRTNISRMTEAGAHQVKITRSGYDSWEKSLEIEPGVLMRIDYVRLFKADRTTTTVREFSDGLGFLSISPNREKMLYAEEDLEDWFVMNISGDGTNEQEIDIEEVLKGEDSEKSVSIAEIDQISWSGDGNRVIVEWGGNYGLIDLRNSKNSLDLEKEFGMQFSEVKMVSNSAENLLVLEGKNLREISTGTREISRVLLSNVVSFDNDGENVIYVAEDERGAYVGIYRIGEKEGVVVRDFRKAKDSSDSGNSGASSDPDAASGSGDVDISDAPSNVDISSKDIKVAIGQYLDKDLAVVVEKDVMTTYRGELPTDSDNLGKMKSVATATLEGGAGELYRYNNGRIFVVKTGAKMAVYDSELMKIVQYELGSEEMAFVDGALIGTVENGRLTVRDFDGENRRELTDADEGYPAVISKNEKWLYKVEDGVIKRENIRD